MKIIIANFYADLQENAIILFVEMKPKIYIETSIPSYLTARLSNDIRVIANQNTTIEWWENRRTKFNLFISEFVLAEASLGNSDAAKRRLSALTNITILKVTEEAKNLTNALITAGPLPKKAEVDAYHIAVATVNGMDYLLTWNCTHIANAMMRHKIYTICQNYGYEPPIICTPQELMEGG